MILRIFFILLLHSISLSLIFFLTLYAQRDFTLILPTGQEIFNKYAINSHNIVKNSGIFVRYREYRQENENIQVCKRVEKFLHNKDNSDILFSAMRLKCKIIEGES